uniref:Uncharacterized protein n=1 Tax=viral metagenome TaxID=1070528 RepID=A0A6C0J0T6_9ZZZZ
MNNIYEPNDSFSFEKIKISKPVSILGGNYFIRFALDNNPLYIQPPKCKTKQGFLKAGKKYYTDLVFTNADDEFIRWMENLENVCHQHLFQNREKWFESDMELHDIENYFTSPLKIYKTGKFYLARVNVISNMGVPNLTIYNENNTIVPIEDINDKTDVITILELKGIKCTTTSFQIEMEMKQMLTVKPVELFNKCIIKMPTQSSVSNNELNEILPEIITPYNVGNNIDSNDTNMIEDGKSIEESNNNENLVKMDVNEDININTDVTVDEEIIVDADINDDNKVIIDTDIQVNEETNNKNEEIDNNENSEDIITVPNQNNELEEVEIHLDELPEDSNINIKESNEVYYEMYREACRKAKIARDLALSSYLEAKRIKNTYMLEDITDSDDSDLEQESEMVE